MRGGPFILIIVAATAGATVVAAASTVGGVSLPGLGAETATVGSCTQAGIASSFVLHGPDVTAVTLDGFPAGCLGRAVSVSVAGSTGASTEATGTVSGSQQVLTLPQPVPGAEVTSLAVIVTG